MNPSIKWFQDARFGMFIHWGLYAIPARSEWVMYNEAIPAVEYAQFAQQFRQPDSFSVKEWIDLALAAGAKYTVLTTRHHEGFCLWDTNTTSFKSTNSPAKRDFVGEYVKAARAAGLKIGLYYSLLDWSQPAYWHGPRKAPAAWKQFIDRVHAQVDELMTWYGKIDILWYDGFWAHDNPPFADVFTPEDWRAAELNQHVRELQPGILINDRSGVPEDFGTPEQEIVAQGRPWEACMTTNDNWGCHKGDQNWKTSRQAIHNLVRAVNKGGNFILNIGPWADGIVPEETRQIFLDMGAWLRQNGESIYGCGKTRHLYREALDGGYYCISGIWTGKPGTLYYHTLRWTGTTNSLRVEGVKILSAELLATGQALPYVQQGDRLIVQGLPENPPDPYDTVLKFTCEEMV